MEKEYIIKLRHGMEIGYGQEITRCKDCEHGKDVGDYGIECEFDGCKHHDEWFCADGEKKKKTQGEKIADDIISKCF